MPRQSEGHVLPNAPSLEQWRTLYEVSARVREMAPWTWMEETEVCAVEEPVTGQMGFVSVMGQLGEHLGIAVYLGGDGLHGFYGMSHSGVSVEAMFMVPQIQVSWEDRDLLDRQDREVIKSLGLKFRGRGAWPWFRSYRPCYFPWFLEADEARFLTVALDQLLDVAPRLRDKTLRLPQRFRGQMLFRISDGIGTRRTWRDEVRAIPGPEKHQLSMPMDLELLARLKELKRGGSVEVDYFLLPTPIYDMGNRPYLPHVMLMVDSRSGAVMDLMLVSPAPDVNSVMSRAPLTLATLLAQTEIRPHEVLVMDKSLGNLLKPLADAVGFRVVYRRHLDHVEQARMSLIMHMSEGH